MKKILIIIQWLSTMTLILSSIIFIYYGAFANHNNYPLGNLGAMEKLFLPLIIILVSLLILIVVLIIKKSQKSK